MDAFISDIYQISSNQWVQLSYVLCVLFQGIYLTNATYYGIKRDLEARDGTKGTVGYSPCMTLGTIAGYLLCTVTPIINYIGVIFYSGPAFIKTTTTALDYVLNYKLVPDSDEYKDMRQQKFSKSSNLRHPSAETDELLDTESEF